MRNKFFPLREWFLNDSCGWPKQRQQLSTLFMDIVGFSKLLVDEQSKCSNRLNQIVRNTDQFRSAEAAEKLIRLPTGDGIVLVFFTSPEAPVRCAIEIATALMNSSDFGLRKGGSQQPGQQRFRCKLDVTPSRAKQG